MTNRPTSRQLKGHFDALRARRSNVSAEVIDVAAGNYGSGKTFAGVTEVSHAAWAGATDTFYVYLDQNDELVLNGAGGFPTLSTWIARVIIASGIILDVVDERAAINSFVDGYQISFDDSDSCAAVGDNVQDALAALDAYVCNDLSVAQDIKRFVDFDIVGGTLSGSVKVSHIDDSPVVSFPNKNSGVGRVRYSASVPPDYVNGTDIVVKIFWSAKTSGAGNVRWRIRYRSLTSGTDNVDITMTIDSLTQSTPGIADRLTDTGINLKIASSDLSPQDILIINVEREHSAADTYNSEARIHLVRMEYIGRGVE